MIVRYTKSQAFSIRTIRLLGEKHWADLQMIVNMINESMEHGGDNKMTLNMVVHDQVVSYLKSSSNIKVVDNKQGQPAGYTLLETVDWV